MGVIKDLLRFSDPIMVERERIEAAAAEGERIKAAAAEREKSAKRRDIELAKRKMQSVAKQV